MWSRRRFLEIVSGFPVVGGIIGTSAVSLAAAPKGRDYFGDLGVRPFINAAGTYTAMTSSLMPPEVMDAIVYASKHYVMLDELNDRVGERIASLLKCEAAMVTSGAASALTLGTAAVLTGTDRQKIANLPNLAGMKSEVIIQKSHRFGYDHAVRNCGVRMVEGDVLDLKSLEVAMTGQGVVYANLSGQMEQQARNMVKGMDAHGQAPSSARCRPGSGDSDRRPRRRCRRSGSFRACARTCPTPTDRGHPP